jgi:hypothetical protein
MPSAKRSIDGLIFPLERDFSAAARVNFRLACLFARLANVSDPLANVSDPLGNVSDPLGNVSGTPGNVSEPI